MTLQELELKLLTFDPYDIVECGLDSFSPYTYLNLSDDMNTHIGNLSPSDTAKWDEFTTEYTERLAMNGVTETIVYLTNHLD